MAKFRSQPCFIFSSKSYCSSGRNFNFFEAFSQKRIFSTIDGEAIEMLVCIGLMSCEKKLHCTYETKEENNKIYT